MVHPDRRFISRARSARYTGASLLLSHPSTDRSSPLTFSLSFSRTREFSPFARRNKDDEKKNEGEKEGREQMPVEVEPGERRRGEEKKVVRNNARGGAFSRDYQRGAEGPLTNGFVNHGRFKVITHRKKES